MSRAERPAVRIDRERLLPGMARQLAALRIALAAGAPRVGWKVGINVPSVQRSLGLDHAVVGWIDGRTIVPADGTYTIPPSSMPHVEPELAVRLGAAVPPSASSAIAAQAIVGVAPALEIVDYARGGADLDEFLSHSMFHAGAVLGEPVELTALDGVGTDWPVVERPGKRAISPRDDLVPADLGTLVSFVARFLGEFGEELRAGDTILSGSFTERAVRLEPGERVAADFGPLGRVAIGVAE